MNILNKFSEFNRHGKIAVTRNDIFSDARDRVLNNIGITKDIRDLAQPAIDYGKNAILPPGGAVPDYNSGVNSQWIATGYKFNSDITPMMLVAGALVIVAGYFIIKKA